MEMEMIKREESEEMMRKKVREMEEMVR